MTIKMKTVSIEGDKLNYLDVNTTCNNTLLFLHGNSHSSKTFINQLSSPFFNEYRLVFVDLPGHGDSDKIEHYSLTQFAMSLNKFISYLDLKNVVIIGHSMGGHIAINLLKFVKPEGLFLFGTPPLTNPFNPAAFLTNPNAEAMGLSSASLDSIERLMKEMSYKNECLSIAIDDYLRTDPKFREEILNDIVAGTHENEVDLIKSFSKIVMILLATDDRLINNNYINDEFLNADLNCQLLEISSGHSPHIEVSFEFNKILADFCKNVFDKNNLFKKVKIDLQQEISNEQRN